MQTVSAQSHPTETHGTGPVIVTTYESHFCKVTDAFAGESVTHRHFRTRAEANDWVAREIHGEYDDERYTITDPAAPGVVVDPYGEIDGVPFCPVDQAALVPVEIGPWKLQQRGVHGWGDIKVSVDDGPYLPDHYATRAEAEEEARLVGELGDDTRVVPVSTPSDEDFYS